MNSDPSRPAISIIIPNLNGEKLLPECLEALKQSTFHDYTVTLVDNGSSDQSIEVARSVFSGIEIVKLEENQGFAGAVQRGVEESHGEFIALLNNDAVPEPGWLGAMLQAVEADPKTGMVACRILNHDGTVIDSLGLAPARNGMAVLIGHGQSPEWVSPHGEPFGPSGAAGLYRREMLDQIGGFPEQFFCYYEDLWVAWQGGLRGWKCVLVNDAVVRHLGQGTSFSGWKNRNYWITLNKWRTIFSCWHPNLVARHLPSITYWDGLAKAGRIFSGEFAQAVSARIKALSEIGYWRKVRKSVYANSTISASECDSWLIPPPKLSELVGRRLR
jgi:GT2 family glycosyltransferase